MEPLPINNADARANAGITSEGPRVFLHPVTGLRYVSWLSSDGHEARCSRDLVLHVALADSDWVSSEFAPSWALGLIDIDREYLVKLVDRHT
jgi:hypothetical protein